MKNQIQESSRTEIVRIVAIYSLFGGLWIYLSDTILVLLVRDPAIITRISLFKGLLFIALTATLLYVLIARYIRRIGIHLSERDQALRNLAQQKALLDIIIEGTTDAVYVKDAEGRYLLANSSVARFVGKPVNEILGQDDLHLFPPDDARSVMAKDQWVMAQSGPRTYEEHLSTSEGERYFLSTKGAMRAEDGEVVGLFGIARDITGLKEQENAKLKIDKLESLGVLAGGIAHDFNNILAGIMGNISYAQMFIDAGHKAAKPLVEAEIASVRARNLSLQLLTFAKGGEPVKKLVSVRQLVQESVSLVLRGSNVKGVVDMADAVHAIEADEGQISQVFHNIVLNAIQAMPQGGVLTVVAHNVRFSSTNALMLQPGAYVKISFIDQGCGISDADLKKIFDPYFTTKPTGTGLGLASVYSIVNRHGGATEVSSAVGNGTTVSVYLPSTGESDPHPQDDTANQSVGQHAGGSILVMDDEEIIRTVAAEMLEYLGYRVTTCGSGSEAVALYEAARTSGSPYSTVIMDLTIPGGMGGKEAAEQILAIDPQACLIVSSGYSNDPIMSDYRRYGFSGAVSKPYTMAELGRMLSSLFNQPRK